MSTWVLGISALFHDAAAALLCDGKLIAAVQEERFTRIKHDPSLPIRSVKWLLNKAGITIDDIDHFVFHEKPLLKFERILTMSVASFPYSWRAFPIQMHAWLSDKLWIRNKLVQTFGIAPQKILFCEHHLSHAASAFFCSPFKDSAILTVDGVGEWATTALWKGSASHPYITPLAEIRYPHSLGLFYSAVTAHLGFAVNNGEYKVMGMSAYGEPKYRQAFDKMIKLHDDGSFSLDLQYFCHHYHTQRATTEKFNDVIGQPRSPASPFDLSSTAASELQKESQHYADIAASAQATLEDSLLHLVNAARKKVDSGNLCLAGGVALNAKANRRLAESEIYDQIWTQPAAGDAGGALGAALWAWHVVLNNPWEPSFFPVNLGKQWSREEVKEFLDDFNLSYTDVGDRTAEHAAQSLADGKIVAWFDGRFEWGPRALGHRSILADPRQLDNRDKINKSVKFREQFRPFAPMALQSEMHKWFDIPKAAEPMLPYMVCTVGVKEEKQELIPAVTHIDQSARVQSIDERHNGQIMSIISSFAEKTDVPVLLNTSFNLKGDPMVSSPVDAVATFLQSDLDLLYIEGFCVGQRKKRR